MPRDAALTLITDLAESLAGQQPVAVSVGPGGEAVLLIVGEADAPGVRGYDEQQGWATFPHSQTPRPAPASVLIHDGQSARRVLLHDLTLAHPHLQPLPGGEILVVGARCRRFANGTAERNAHFYGADGLLRQAVTFGDAIANVQTTTNGDIWVAYFDEGVFGNYGWGHDEQSTPIGAMGLVRFDGQGTKSWEYEPPDGVGPIDDCYALNVGDEATWAYYYSDFPLVRIGSDGRVRAWRTEVSGAHAFAVDGQHLLFFGGYRSQAERCLLGNLRDDGVTGMETCRLVLPSGEPLENGRVIGRGPNLHVFVGTAWYGVDVRTVI